MKTPAHDFATRRAIYEEIEAARGSKVINYVTGDRPGMETNIGADVIELFVEHLDALWPAKKLTLLLYTSGGDIAAAWRIVNLMRAFCDELEIIITSKALSAGTLMCLGANRIVMTKQAALGPIDPSINHPLGPRVPGGLPYPVSVEAIQGYLDIAQEQLKIQTADSLTQVLTHLASQVHPLVLGQVFRSRNQIRFLADRLLRHQDIENEQKEDLISFLCSDSGSHDYTINRREARELGLVVENPSEDLYRVLKNLQDNIRATMQLRAPFVPEIILADREEITYTVRCAMLESAAHGCHHLLAEGRVVRIPTEQPEQPTQPIVSDQRIIDEWRKEA